MDNMDDEHEYRESLINIGQIAAASRLPTPATRRLLRANAGVQVSELANALHVTRQTIWLWESGGTEPSGSNRRRYALVLENLKGLL